MSQPGRYAPVMVWETAPLMFAIVTPCGESLSGMTESDDLPILVRRALYHVRTCEECRKER